MSDNEVKIESEDIEEVPEVIKNPRRTRSAVPKKKLSDKDEKIKENVNALYKKKSSNLSPSDKTKIINEIREEDYDKFARTVLSALLGGDIASIGKRLTAIEDAIAGSSVSKESKKEAIKELHNIAEAYEEEPPKTQKKVVPTKQLAKKKFVEEEPEPETEKPAEPELPSELNDI